MKKLLAVIFIILNMFLPAYADCILSHTKPYCGCLSVDEISDDDIRDVKNIYIAATYQPNVQRIEQMFKQRVNLDKGVVFTVVPRGLVISFDEKLFFHPGEARIKESSLYILDVVAEGLKKIPNDCVVENHTTENVSELSDYNYDWELSMSRAGNITQYLINCAGLNSKRMFALGYGEFMPFKDNVAPKEGMDNRIDIVILEYEAKR